MAGRRSYNSPVLPASYSTPAAIVLVLGGALSCFAGYRLFRLILGLYGFYLGALITTSAMGAADTWTLVLAGVVGGLAGAVLMYAAYFLGVGLIGAGLAALALNAVWGALTGGAPPTVMLVVICVIGALAALSIVRWVVIFGTAIAGAWTLLVGALALFGTAAATGTAATGDIWVLYPLNPLPERAWVTAAWFGLSIAGIVVQSAVTSRMRVPVRRRPARA
jgi:hypothetical protein